MTKILVTGGKGQLGQSFQSISENFKNMDITFTDVNDIDICNIDNIREFVSYTPYNYIINCAAYTAVDKAESDKIASIKLNADAVKNIGIVAKENDIPVIHISTDYVFDGNSFKPYAENDYAVPSSHYGQTKLLGENYLLDSQPNSIVIRTAWLYSEFGNNFVKTMIKLGNERDQLKVVADQVGSPTYAVDLAEGILNIILKIENKTVNFTPGIYHFSNEGVCSWYDFTINIHQLIGIDCHILPIESKEYPTAAPRPYYSVLNKTKIKTTYKIEIPYWRFSLEKCLRKLANKN